MFGKSQNKKVDYVSTCDVCHSEDEGWEVVKQNINNEQSKAKNNLGMTAGTVDVGTSTENPVEEEVSKCEKHVQTIVDATTFLEETDALIGCASNVIPTFPTSVDAIPGIVPLQEILASLDLSRITDHGNKGYFLMKRNLKTVALLLLLGVFCTGSIPTGRSKSENGVPPPPSVDDTAKNPDDYGLLIETLKARIVELEEISRNEEREFSMTIYERDHWRRSALSCKNDLRQMSEMHSRLDDEMKQMKSLAPLDPTSPISAVEHAIASDLATFNTGYKYPTPHPSPARRIPYPQLALPGIEPRPMLPIPSMKMNVPYTGIVVAPSLAVMAV